MMQERKIANKESLYVYAVYFIIVI